MYSQAVTSFLSTTLLTGSLAAAKTAAAIAPRMAVAAMDASTAVQLATSCSSLGFLRLLRLPGGRPGLRLLRTLAAMDHFSWKRNEIAGIHHLQETPSLSFILFYYFIIILFFYYFIL